MNAQQAVALGRTEADLVVRNGRVFRPEPAEFAAADLAVVEGRVAAQLSDDAETDAVVGPDTTVLDAEGQYVVPGFVDAHTHVDVFQPVEATYPYKLRGGTTALVAEASVFGVTHGVEGVEALLDASADLPMAVRFAVSPLPLVETFEDRHPVDEQGLCDLLARDRVCGVGELGWIHVVGRDCGAQPLYERAEAERKPVSAHGAGCEGAKLQALAGQVDNDHEAVTPEGFAARVEAGIHAVGRSGSIRDDAPALAAAYRDLDPAATAELSLSTDGMWPADLRSAGYIDEVLRRVIDAGVDPADALRMATLNPARHFGFEDRGTLAPGNVADVVLLDDLESVAVDTVVAAGEVVVRDGDALVDPRPHEYPDRFYDSVDVGLSADAFAVSDGLARDGAVRAIEHRQGLLTAETTVEPATEDGTLVPDPDAEVLKVAHVDHHPRGDGAVFTGFLTGYGLTSGAAATTITWESPAIVGVGAADADLRAAVERVVDLDGGWAVVEDGDVTAELPTPLGGTCTTRPVPETADELDGVRASLRAQGVTADRPLLSVQTLTFTGVPALKLSRSGYADIRTRDVVGLTPGGTD